MFKKYRTIFLITAIYFMIAVFFTFPLIIDFLTRVYAQPGDSFGMLHFFWWVKNNSVDYMFPNAPIFIFLGKIGTMLFNEIVAYNLFTIFGFILTGLAGYLLVKKITQNTWAAFFSGLILTLAPFRLAQTLQHLNFSDLSGLLFFIYFLLSAHEQPNLKNIFLSGLFFALTTLMNYQYGFLAMVVFSIFLLFIIIKKVINKSIFKINKQIILPIILTLLFICLSVGYFIAPAVKDTLSLNKGGKSEVVSVRNKEELKVYSAHWFYYLYPSPENPLFAKYTKSIYQKVVDESGTNQTEQILYLGWVPLLLTIYGIWQMVKIKNQTLPTGRQESKIKIYSLFFIILGILSLYFSFAPQVEIFGLTIKTPAYYIFPHLPYFRVYARFGLLVVISVSVLAGIGLSFMLEKIRSKKIALLLYCFITLLLLLEFINFPPFHTIDVSGKAMPESYQYLKTQPVGTVVEYPLLPSEEPKSYTYLLWRRYHQFSILYGGSVDPNFDTWRPTIVNIENEKTVEKLKEIGVKYVIIHQDRYTQENAKKYPAEYNGGVVPIIKSDLVELVGTFGEDELYRLK